MKARGTSSAPWSGWAAALPTLPSLRSELWADCGIVVCLLGLTTLVRLLTLQPVENGGDPLDNWYFVRQWAHNPEPFRGYLNHHQARVGIHWVTWIVQRLWGHGIAAYYVAPLLASHACTALTYVAGKQAGSRGVGVLAALLLLEFKPMAFASSQLRPGVFEAMYALAALVCLLAGLRRLGASRDRWLVAAGLCSFLGYLTKVPDLFCVPGMALVIWLGGGGRRGLLVYGGALGAGLLLETAAYALFTDYAGRVAVILNAHARSAPAAHDFWWLFTRFTKAGNSWQLLFYFFFAASLSVLARRRPVQHKAAALVAGSFLLLATFGLRRINPVGVWMGMNDRYLTLAAPLAFLVSASVIVEAGRAALRGLARWGVGLGPARRLLAATLPRAGAVALLGCASCVGVKSWVVHAPRLKSHPLKGMPRVSSVISDAYARSLPIVADVTRRPTKRRPWAQVRALHWAVKGFVDEALLLDEDGHLPNFSYARGLGYVDSRRRYVPLSPDLDTERVRQLLRHRKECVITLKAKGQNVRVSSKKWKMPDGCPRAQFERALAPNARPSP